MSKDKFIGSALMVGSIIVIAIYGYLVFMTDYWRLVLQLTGFIAIAGLFSILAWIGYTLATTPPPKSIEEIEKELEQELKKLEEEVEEEGGKTDKQG